VTLDAGI